MSYPRLAERLYNTPLAVMPEKAEVIERVFDAMMRGEKVAEGKPHAEAEDEFMREYAALLTPARRTDGGYALTQHGVAVIPMFGSLVHRGTMMDALSGMTSYAGMTQKLDAALRDPLVRGVVLDIDSGGGEVAGAFELADFVASAHKPVWAVANELSASAAYLVMSAAQRIFVPQAAQVGSIGILMMHVDRSAIVERSGVRYTPIYAGAKKMDGSSLAPLTESARLDLQARVDKVYGMMVDVIASRRGMKADRVRATEAGMMSADEAIASGFADQAGGLQAAINALQAEVSRLGFEYKPRAARASIEDIDMSDKQTTTTTAATPAAGVQPAAAAAPQPAAEVQKPAEQAQDAALAERARISAILQHAEATGRSALAQHLAFKTTMSVDDAVAMMAAAPKEVAKAANPLAELMKNTNPGVGADTEAASATHARPSISATNVYAFRKECVDKAKNTR
jgi:capsid assembly protease